MAFTESLYYPMYDPPVGWLKANLLFTQKIRSIVPHEVRPVFAPANDALFQLDPKLFEPYRYKQGQVNMDVNLPMLNVAFSEIASKKKPVFTFNIGPDGGISVPGYTFLHRSKMTDRVEDLLQAHGLVIPQIGEQITRGRYLLTEERASRLIVSLIADNIAMAKGWASVTERPLEYSVTLTNGLTRSKSSDASDLLAGTIIQLEVPRRLEAFTAKEFLELRKRYEPLREAFQLAVDEVCQLEALDRIGDEKTLRERVSSAAEKFGVEVAKLRQHKWSTKIKDWMPFSLTSAGRVIGMIPFLPIKAVGVGIQIGVSFYEKVRSVAWAPPRKAAQRMLASLQTDILSAKVVKKLITSA